MKTKNDNHELPQSLVRLQQFIDHEGLTIYKANQMAGLSTGLLSNAFSKHQGLTITTVEAILRAFPQLNANWLIMGRGEMLNDVPGDDNPPASVTQQHIAHLDALLEQSIQLAKTIQQMKQQEQSAADARLLDSLR